jgi:ribokinase
MPEKIFDAVGIGACNLDTVAFVRKFTECEEKINAFDYVPPRAAGVALDAITMLSYLGMRCGFIGKRGDDYFGKVFDEEMHADRIDLSSAMTLPGERTSLAWIQVKEDGERCHVIIPMSERGMLKTAEMEERRDYLRSARVCHMELLQNPVAPLIRAAEICREAGTLVSVDLDVAPCYLFQCGYATEKELDTLLGHADVLKACKNAVPSLSSSKDMERAALDILAMGPRTVVITVGEKGCVVASREGGAAGSGAHGASSAGRGARVDAAADAPASVTVPAFAGGGVKDTTGAGDAFQGGFLYGVLKGWDLRKAAAFANACGYLKSLRVGARNMPRLPEVENFVKTKGRGIIA